MAIPSSNRDRVRLIALSVLVVCCVGFVAGLLHLHNQAAYAPIANTNQPPDPQLVVDTESRKKEKVLELRNKWRIWAKAHQSELRAMLQARSNDMATLQSVIAAMPEIPTKRDNGFGLEEFAGIKNFSDPVVYSANYAHLNLHVIPTTPQDKHIEDEAQELVQLSDKTSFSQLRDVVVVGLDSAWSKKSYCLWASGRVTESQYTSPMLNKEYTTILPSYDFVVR